MECDQCLRVRKLERSQVSPESGARGLGTLRPGQHQEEELHYASLQRLPRAARGNGERDAAKEDASADYACVAKKKPT
ncbi:PREDICTED: leukocyte-specific transcript 1 protein isoform X3 [Chinchilla lanigera]|uniref:leukocyte-specific transcript 1 protein isoform X3 n=1 Tax=Chinchilla lanigera TaxID=34839 RepID=UPI000697A275|nr:PREDICTED: leukocyte-specific transcript 1 protein isoform X3 [Chinchilla lanigera]